MQTQSQTNYIGFGKVVDVDMDSFTATIQTLPEGFIIPDVAICLPMAGRDSMMGALPGIGVQVVYICPGGNFNHMYLLSMYPHVEDMPELLHENEYLMKSPWGDWIRMNDTEINVLGRQATVVINGPTFVTVNGPATISVTGNVTGNIGGDAEFSITGNVTGDIGGHVELNITGDVIASIGGELALAVTGAVSANITGEVLIEGEATVVVKGTTGLELWGGDDDLEPAVKGTTLVGILDAILTHTHQVAGATASASVELAGESTSSVLSSKVQVN